MSTRAWFTGGVASWFTAWGMNALVFSWLVVGVLEAEARYVGIAQTSTMLPSLVLLLWGGALADRLDPRRVLVALHLLATLPILALSSLIAGGGLTLGILLAYGATLGTFQAFVMPARDALLSRVSGPDMMRAVTLMTMFQFGGQAAGTLLAGFGQPFGIELVLAVQAGILAAGAYATLRVAEGPARPRSEAPGSALAQIREGVATVARTPNLRVPVFLVTLVGILFIGPYLVVFPLLVRDLYHGGARELSFALMTFPIGTIVGSLAIRARGGIGRKGLALLLALAAGATTQLVMSLGLPFPAFIAAGLVWGLGGAVFINSSRTLVQEAAPAEARGRVLAAYQVGFVGGGPVGTLLAGALAESLGPLATLAAGGGAMLLSVLAVAAVSDARRMR
ncbi:MAG: hypothetical protein CL910_10660 [Deltaproteobacteria bacterium]|nr:hypothetical protein [Deltaproteobacteria bacterium]